MFTMFKIFRRKPVTVADSRQFLSDAAAERVVAWWVAESAKPKTLVEDPYNLFRKGN